MTESAGLLAERQTRTHSVEACCWKLTAVRVESEELVPMAEGRPWVESEVGKGSTFFTLPLRQASSDQDD